MLGVSRSRPRDGAPGTSRRGGADAAGNADQMSLAIRAGRASVRQAVRSRLRSRSPRYLLPRRPRSSGMRSRGAGSKASSRRSQPCPAARGSPPGPALVGPARRDLLPFRRAPVVPQQRAGAVGSRAGLGARGEASPPRQRLQGREVLAGSVGTGASVLQG